MKGFLQQAEDILDVACTDIACAQEGGDDYAIFWDRHGALRMLDGGEWSLPALSSEFGAKAVFRVERRRGAVRVEGWDGARRCLLQGQRPDYMMCRATGRSNPASTMLSRNSSSATVADFSCWKDIVTTSQSSETQRWLTNRYSVTSSESFNATRIF